MSVSRERMLEYLYDELPAQERAAFEQQLAASEADQRELASLQATLQDTRALLANDPPPPARVRSAVLAAAAAQLQAAAGSADAPTLPRRAAASPGGPADLSQQRVRRWLRATWIVPSLAVAAATLLMLKQRGELFPERAESAERAAPQASAPEITAALPQAAELERPTAPAPESAAASGERPGASASAEAIDTRPTGPAPAVGSAAKSGRRESAPPSSASEPEMEAVAAMRAPSRASARSSRPVPPQSTRARGVESRPAESARAALDGEGAVARSGRAPSPAPTASTRRAADEGFAQPPPDWQSDDLLAGELSQHAEAERVPEAPAPAAAKRARSAPARAHSPVEAEAPQPSAAGVARQEPAAAPAPTLSLVELEKRAREHAAAGRRTQAATDYRELIRRFPQHAHVSAWKRELVQLTADAGTRSPAAR